MKFNPNVLDVEGRFLPPPTLRYTQTIPLQSAAWNARGHKFSHPGGMKKWTYLYIEVKGIKPAFDGPCAASQFNDALTDFVKGLVAPRITVQGYTQGKKIILDDEDDVALEVFLEAATKANFDVIWVVIPPGMKSLYDRIKYLGDVKFGITTVVSVDRMVLGKSDGQGRGQYFGDEALKVNLKLKGRNQVVSSSLYFVNDGETMILGVDVTHPSADRRKIKYPSVAGVVMCDNHLARYHSVLSIQNKRQEMISRLGYMVASMLQKWRAIHGTLPRNILIYRDGVSEGQYDMVRDQELVFIKKACEPIYAEGGLPPPRITVIIVAKRHHTRFAPKYDADKKGNCRAGLVVDRGITDMRLWNFFLQPHSTIQGQHGLVITLWSTTKSSVLMQKPRI